MFMGAEMARIALTHFGVGRYPSGVKTKPRNSSAF
jgi:hypothetical protein